MVCWLHEVQVQRLVWGEFVEVDGQQQLLPVLLISVELWRAGKKHVVKEWNMVREWHVGRKGHVRRKGHVGGVATAGKGVTLLVRAVGTLYLYRSGLCRSGH